MCNYAFKGVWKGEENKKLTDGQRGYGRFFRGTRNDQVSGHRTPPEATKLLKKETLTRFKTGASEQGVSGECSSGLDRRKTGVRTEGPPTMLNQGKSCDEAESSIIKNNLKGLTILTEAKARDVGGQRTLRRLKKSGPASHSEPCGRTR